MNQEQSFTQEQKDALLLTIDNSDEYKVIITENNKVKVVNTNKEEVEYLGRIGRQLTIRLMEFMGCSLTTFTKVERGANYA